MRRNNARTYFWLSLLFVWLAFCALAIGVMQYMEAHPRSPSVMMRRVQRAQSVTLADAASVLKSVTRYHSIWVEDE